MAAINLEMLRELLGEFTEKELVLREERDIIEQQIVELDSRIEQNKKKLDGLSADRAKVDAMRERYLSGNWKAQQEQNGRENSRPVAVKPAAAEAAPVQAAPVQAEEVVAVNKEISAPTPEATPTAVNEPLAKALPEVAEPAQDAAPRDYSKPQISGISGPAPAVTAAAQDKSTEVSQVQVSANSTSQSLPAQASTESLAAPLQAAEPPSPAAVEPPAAPVISAPVFEAAPAPVVEPTPIPEPTPAPAPAPAPVAETNPEPIAVSMPAPIPAPVAAPPAATPVSAPVNDPILNALGNAPPVSAPDVMPSISPVVSTHAGEESASAFQDASHSAVGYGAAAHGAGMPADPWGYSGAPSNSAPDTVPGAYPPGSPMDAWGAPTPAQPQAQTQQSAAPFADIAAAADAIQVPTSDNQPGGPGWGDFGEDWITPGGKDAAPSSTADSLPPVNPGDQITAQPQAPAQVPSAVTGWGDWGDGSQAQPVTPPASVPNWGQPTPQVAPQPAPQAAFPEAPAAESTGGGWGQPQAQPNFSQPAASSNPWGAPSAGGAIGASPGTLPPGSPSPAFDNPWGTPTAGNDNEGEAKPSSLAGAAGGALLSNPRNRRRREPQPAFDWGGDDQGQAPGPAPAPAPAQAPVADWGQPQPQASVADWGQPQAADSSDNSANSANSANSGQIGAKGEEVDEGAKKINDALRGLFKK